MSKVKSQSEGLIWAKYFLPFCVGSDGGRKDPSWKFDTQNHGTKFRVGCYVGQRHVVAVLEKSVDGFFGVRHYFFFD